jgi:hypothetical protein
MEDAADDATGEDAVEEEARAAASRSRAFEGTGLSVMIHPHM